MGVILYMSHVSLSSHGIPEALRPTCPLWMLWDSYIILSFTEYKHVDEGSSVAAYHSPSYGTASEQSIDMCV